MVLSPIFLSGLVDLEGQRIVGARALERDATDAGEVFALADEGCVMDCRESCSLFKGSVDLARGDFDAPAGAGSAVGLPIRRSRHGVRTCAEAGLIFTCSRTSLTRSDWLPAVVLAHSACNAAPRAAPSGSSGTSTGSSNTSATIWRQAALRLPPPVRRIDVKPRPAARQASNPLRKRIGRALHRRTIGIAAREVRRNPCHGSWPARAAGPVCARR